MVCELLRLCIYMYMIPVLLPNITKISVERQTWNFKYWIPDVFSVDLFYTKIHYAFIGYYLERKELIEGLHVSSFYVKLSWGNQFIPQLVQNLSHFYIFWQDVTLGTVNGVCVLYNYIVHGFKHLCCIFHYIFLACLLGLHFTFLIIQFRFYQIWNTDFQAELNEA